MTNELITISKTAKIFVWNEAVSMGCGFPRLTALVKSKPLYDLGKKFAIGNLYFFVNRKFNYCKVLFNTQNGMCILAKKLDAGKFTIDFEHQTISIPDLSRMLLGAKKKKK